MNQKGALGLIVGIIIVAVVIIGGIAYFMFSKGNSECQKICEKEEGKDFNFNYGRKKTNGCNIDEIEVNKCCCSTIVGGGSGAGGTDKGQTPGVSGDTLEEWCTPGPDTSGARDIIIAQSGSKGSSIEVVKDEMQGIKTFKGKPACHIVLDLLITPPKGGQKITSHADIYVYKFKDDTWIINTTQGVVTYEYHWVNGNSTCIEGSGCDLINLYSPK